MPFDALLTEDGKPLLEAYAVRLMQTGRDLVARDRRRAKGLWPSEASISASWPEAAPSTANAGLTPAAHESEVRAALETTRGELGGFTPLPKSGEEVDAIAKVHGHRRSGEPQPVVYKGLEATKAHLKALAAPPCVLHLATHGFYLTKGSIAGEPLLQSGVALARANDGLAGRTGPGGDNGILHALEAAGLKLFGTELVVLYACQTGQGVSDYSEGLEGLPSAFYVAGAKNVLVALWNVGDKGAEEFMKTFYDRWTLPAVSDPAGAPFRPWNTKKIPSP